MQHMNATLFQYQGVVGYAYHDVGNTRAIVWCKGGPDLGDNGDSELFSQISSELKVSVIVPDYLGSGRSAGAAFTIQRAVQTISICEKFLLNDQAVVDCWKNEKVSFGVDDVLLVGHSWGATMAALYPKFYPETAIKSLGFLAGVLDYDPDGHLTHGGESDAEFWQQIENGWTNYYRGILDSDWKDLVLGVDSTHSPMKNIEVLRGKDVKLFHGKRDEIVAFQRSEQFHEVLEAAEISSQLVLTEDDHFSMANLENVKSFT